MKNRFSFDVAVIGGGPSGLLTARLLAREGLEVLVLEKKADVGQGIVCTGIIGRDVFAEFGLSDESVLREIQDVRLVSSQGRTISYRHPEPFALVVDRGRFDGAMSRQAVSAGVTISTATKVTGLAVLPDGVHLRLEGQAGPRAARANVVVLATGVDHRLHASLGLSTPRSFWYGAQAEIEWKEDAGTSVFVGKDLIPGGFAWSVRASGSRTRIGLLTDGDPYSIFRRFVGTNFPGPEGEGAVSALRIKPIAQGMAARSVGDRALAVGEAAGQVKTTTGGGVAYGLLGARLAAETILEASARGRADRAALAPYEKRWKEELRREIRIGLYARRIFDWLTAAQVETLFTVAQSDGVIPLMQREGRFDRQSGLILSVIRTTSVFGVLKALPRKPAFLEDLLH